MTPKLKQANTRREQVKKAGSTMLIVVAFSAVIVMFSLISIRFLWEKKSYNDRVIEAKTKARDDINNNLANLKKLSQQFPELDNSVNANTKIILHALPPVYDYAALASSIDYLASVSGVETDISIGEDISASAVSSASTSTPVELPLSLQVRGSYDAVKQYINNLEKSVRPILVTSATYTGNSTSLQLSIQATTYYQPSRSLDVLRSPLQ